MEINEFNNAIMTQEITHERAKQAALKIIAGAFNRTDNRPQFSIPVRPDDDDIILMEYLRRQKSPWRDIESAPKDGTRILAFARGHTDYYGVAKWAEADPNLHRPNGVWLWDYLIRPTYWMPLQEPPR